MPLKSYTLGLNFISYLAQVGTNQFEPVTLVRISTSFVEEKAKKGALFEANNKLQPHRSINK